MPFPNTVHYGWPAGFPGAWAGQNPQRMVVPGANGFRAGAGGVNIAAFAWVQADGATVLNKPDATTPTAAPTGFVVRSQQGLGTRYLQENTMTIAQGFMVALASGGDVFALATTASVTGQAVYASLSDGTLQCAAAGADPTGTVDTGWTVAQGAAAGLPFIMTGPLAVARSTASSTSGTGN
ncbi:structural cement protein Gp24 [Acetobacter ghanensis]|uniref:structural cement protein Gp24 n=1 Tax=Acetobacter ghanensis TaxID=431306 RepID=UPI003D335A6B